MNVILLANDSLRRDHLRGHATPWVWSAKLGGFTHETAAFGQCCIASHPTVPRRWALLTGRFAFACRG